MKKPDFHRTKIPKAGRSPRVNLVRHDAYFVSLKPLDGFQNYAEISEIMEYNRDFYN